MSWKNLVLQLWPKMLSTNQIAVFFDHQNISGRSQVISQILCVEIIIKERSHLILLLLLGCGKFCSLPKRVAGFSIFNIPGRNQSISYIFLQGNNHQWKVASETTTFDWVWQIVPFVQSDCRISSYTSH